MMAGTAFHSRRRLDLSNLGRGLAVAILVAIAPLPLCAEDQKMVRIGVIRSGAIHVLESNEKGFEAALAGVGLKEGVNATFDVQTVGNDPERALAAVQKFLSDKVVLIHSMGTGPTAAAVKATNSVPVVFSAVTDPVGAGIVPAGGAPDKPTGTNVTGVSDRWPIALQLETYSKIAPNVKKWGTLYNPAESNSVTQVNSLRVAARKLGLELVEVTVKDTSDTAAAAQALAQKVQAIFIVSDNTVAAAIQSVADACHANRIPFFTGSFGSLGRGALAAYGVDYFLVGYAAGKKAVLALRGVNPGLIPWDLAEHFGLTINLKVAKALGIAVPADMLRVADRVME